MSVAEQDAYECERCGCPEPEEVTGGWRCSRCEYVPPECTCYELTGGHQPGCYFNRNPIRYTPMTATAECRCGAEKEQERGARGLQHAINCPAVSSALVLAQGQSTPSA